MNADKLTQQVETACWRAAALHQHALESPLLAEALEELCTALDELRVTSYQLRQHNQVVEAELERYIELFSGAPDGYLVTDGSGTIREANRAAAMLLNTQPQKLLSEPLSRFLADEQRPAFSNRLTQLHRGEQLQEWTVLLQPIDTPPFEAALAVNAVRDRESIELRVCMRNVTEHKRVLEKERLVAASAQRIRQSLDLEEILNTTVAEVRQFLQTDRVIVYRFRPDWTGDVVVESVAAGWSSMVGMSITNPLGETYIHSLRQGEITAIENIYTAGIDQYHIDLVARFGVIGDLVVPILHEEQLWGLLIAHHCSQPRQWQQLEIDLLKSLATQTAIAIHQAQLYKQLAKSEEKFRQLAETIRDVFWMLDAIALEPIYISPAYEQIWGRTCQSWYANPWSFRDAVHPDDRELVGVAIARHEQGEEIDIEYRIVQPTGEIRWIRDRAFFVCDELDKISRLVGIASDITERKQAEEQIKASLQEKEVLLKEIHHRVKNNLQVISSLLDLQVQQLKEPELQAIFQDSCNRIKSMALVHENLYQSRNYAQVNFPEYIESLTRNLLQIYGVRANLITLEKDLDEVTLSLETAIPCGLIINELVSNALKHAFPNSANGAVSITLRFDGGNNYVLTIRDSGVGLPFNWDNQAPKSLGLQLVKVLAEQLNGVLQVDCHSGTEFRLIFSE